MAYEAHKWKIGEEITSEKLNHIEKGIEEAGLPREITNPQDGQILKYDAEKGKWVNGEGGGSTLAVTAVYDESTDVTTLDKTWQEISDAFPNVYLAIGALKETVLSVLNDGGYYDVYAAFVQGSQVIHTTYRTSAANGYPSDDEGGGDIS